MRTAAQDVGDAAEARVAAYLVGLGWQILATRLRVGRAELDIVAIDRGPPPMLVVVEVRWRVRRDYGLPEETVDRRKWTRLQRAAFTLREAGRTASGTVIPRLPLRFDLIVVEPDRALRHHRYVS